MKQSPWSVDHIMNILWDTVPKSRKRIRNNGVREVLIYSKAHGTHWTELASLDSQQIYLLSKEFTQ